VRAPKPCIFPGMTSGGWHLAQVNVARLLAPLESPQLAGFVEALDPINAIADGSPGFVWRLQTEDGDATAIRPYDDDRILVNMSVWESVEALGRFVFESRHLEVLRRRREWFEKMAEAYLALWWIPAGTIPKIAEARSRLDCLRRNGPTPYAFTLRESFPSPEATDSVIDDRWLCPA
jgi:Domain of unknown function (DUF3291)